MNQLYHPQRTAEFLSFAGQCGVPVFVITNNVVADLATFADPERKVKTYDGVEAFLRSNQLDKPFLASLARAHYTSRYAPPRKPFDFYTAIAVTAFLGEGRAEMSHMAEMDVRRLYYSNVYGMTFLSARDTWPAARAEYVARITRPLPEGADAFARTRHANFQKEAAVLNRWDGMASLPAVELRFSLDPETRRLELILGVAA